MQQMCPCHPYVGTRSTNSLIVSKTVGGMSLHHYVHHTYTLCACAGGLRYFVLWVFVCLSVQHQHRSFLHSIKALKCRTLGALCIYGACTNTICTWVTVNSVSIIVHAPIIINRCMLFCLVLAQKTCSPDLHTLCLIGTIGCQGPSLGA